MIKKRLRAGVFSFTCCEGCSIMFIELLNKKFFEYKEKLDIQNMRVLKSSNKIGSLDLAIIEGAISTASELKKLREIRKKAKKVAAIGSCAIIGMPSSQRNNFSIEMKEKIKPLVKKLHQLERILPLKNYVKTDYEINGCPINADDLGRLITKELGKDA